MVPIVNGIDFGASIINLTGSVANNGIAGQGVELGHHRSRRSGPLEQRAERPRPALRSRTTLSFIDSLSHCAAITS